MISVGGLLLGAVLTAPGAVGGTNPAGVLAEPFDPSVPRVAIARGDEALGLRDPFGVELRAPAQPRPPVGAAMRADLRDPFGARVPQRAVAAPPVLPARADLRSPFAVPPGHPRARQRSERRAPAARTDLRDPFGA